MRKMKLFWNWKLVGIWFSFPSSIFAFSCWCLIRSQKSKVKRESTGLFLPMQIRVGEASPNRTGKQEFLQCYLWPVSNKLWNELSTEMKQAAGFIFRHLQKGGISHWFLRVVSCERSLALTQSLCLATKVILTSIWKSCCNYKQVRAPSNWMPRFCHVL